jgi:hypothetical protein
LGLCWPDRERNLQLNPLGCAMYKSAANHLAAER